MTDIFGNKLEKGDKVVCTRKSSSSKGFGLILGVVYSVSTVGNACRVIYQSTSSVSPQYLQITLRDNIMKYNWSKNECFVIPTGDL